MNIIDERNKRTVRRKLAKEMIDSTIDLATQDNVQTVRLLDEGVVTYSDGSIDFYIEKGVLKEYLDSLDENYEGTINLGHMDFATYPKVLGTWKKSDLHLVDIGDGRSALDVDLRLNYDLSDVKDLAMMPYDIAVSAEFSYECDRENSEKLGFLCINKLFISDFAIVGDGGNVNSNGITLKGGNRMEKEIAKLKETIASKETEKEPEKELTVSEEVLDLVRGLSENIKTLNTKIDELKAENSELKDQLSAKEKSDAEFYDKFQNLKLSLTEAPKPSQKPKTTVLTNPIGE